MPITVAPGSVVQVRDEEWLVSTVEQTDDGQLLTVQGLSDLVRGTTATFYEHLDNIIPLDPHDATPVADASPHYRDARLWLEATLRKTPIPLGEPTLAASQYALASACSTSIRPYSRPSTRKTCDRASSWRTRWAWARQSRSG